MRPEPPLSPASGEARSGPVLLYDATCGLCNRSVRLLLRIDRRGVLRFSALQGGPAQAWLRSRGLPTADFDSMVLVRDWGAQGGGPAYLLRTDALAAALEACGGAGRVLAWIRLLPRSWRDPGYRLVASLRHRLFGAWAPRALARPDWKERFIGEPS
jgi:predicted DCC family thiol-disulfide oxidoreductase YuxK